MLSRGRPGHLALVSLAVIATALFVLLLWPFASPLLLAAFLATVLQRWSDRFGARIGGRRRIAALCFTAAVLLLIVVPLGGVGGFAASEAASGLAYMRDELGVANISELPTAKLPAAAEEAVDRLLGFVHITREQLQSGIGEAANRAKEISPALLASSGRIAIHAIVMLLALYFLLVEGHRLTRWLRTVSPLEPRDTDSLLSEFERVAKGAILGNFATALLQGVTAGIGYAVFGIPHAAFFGMLTAIASLVPIVGTAVIWVPACALLAISGHVGAGIGLAAWCIVGVVGVEHLAKPFILSATMGGELHPGLMLVGLLGGLEIFGLVGMLAGPLIVALFISVMDMLAKTNTRRDEPPPSPAVEGRERYPRRRRGRRGSSGGASDG